MSSLFMHDVYDLDKQYKTQTSKTRCGGITEDIRGSSILSPTCLTWFCSVYMSAKISMTGNTD